MNVVGVLIPADGAHVGVEAFADVEAVLLQGVALPFGQRVDNFGRALVLFPDAKGNGALHTVQVVVETGFRGNEKRRGHAQQVKLLCQGLLEKVFDCLDGYLGVIEPQRRGIIRRYVQMFHNQLLLILKILMR